MDREFPALLHEVSRVYHGLDRQIHSFQKASGLGCPPRCGTCCGSEEVRATVLECLPLGVEIWRRKHEDVVLAAVERRSGEGDPRCVLFRPDPGDPGRGRCSVYAQRPLVCRMFGFASRRGRLGRLEPALCRHRAASPAGAPPDGDAASAGADRLPVYQDAFYRIASLSPGSGFTLHPINTAVRLSLAYLYWKRPQRRRGERAA